VFEALWLTGVDVWSALVARHRGMGIREDGSGERGASGVSCSRSS